MADLTHSASRDIDQPPDVVHARLLELAERLRQEAPPVPAGSQPAMLLGIDGPLGIETIDRGPSRIELRTTRGRVRGEGSAVLAALDGGTRTKLTMSLAISFTVSSRTSVRPLIATMASSTIRSATCA